MSAPDRARDRSPVSYVMLPTTSAGSDRMAASGVSTTTLAETPWLRSKSMDNESSAPSVGRAVTAISTLILAIVPLAVALSGGKRQKRHSDQLSAFDGETHASDKKNVPDVVPVAELRQLPTAIKEYEAQVQANAPRDKWRFRLEVAGFFLLIATALLAGLNLWTLKNQADIAQEQLETTDRPWLKVAVVPRQLVVRDGSVTLQTEVTVSNVGRSVATHADVELGLYPNNSSAQAFQTQRRLCEAASLQQSRNLVLFPSDRIPQDALPSIQQSDLRVRDLPLLIGCVSYRFGTATKTHYTKFMYEIGRGDPSDPTKRLPLDPANLVDILVRLDRYFSGGNEAECS